jgi:Spy/CpxP family protein refolding chaperone
MKNNLITALVVLFVAALFAFGVGRSMRCAKPPSSMDVLQDVSWLSRNLNLTKRQELDIRKLQETLQVRLQACDSMQCAARCQLGEALFSQTHGPDKARDMLDEMCRAQAESERATLEHIQSVHRLLNPEQQKRYAELVSRCVCSTCQHQPAHGP